jgi:hypothetical protein
MQDIQYELAASKQAIGDELASPQGDGWCRVSLKKQCVSFSVLPHLVCRVSIHPNPGHILPYAITKGTPINVENRNSPCWKWLRVKVK